MPADDKSMMQQKLTDLTRGMYHAVSTTNALVAQHFEMLMERYFEKRSDDTYKAKTVKIALDDGRFIMVPLISLITPKGFFMEMMRIEMSVQMDKAEVKRISNDTDFFGSKADEKLERTSFTINLAPRDKPEAKRRPTDIVDIVMEFKSFDPPEGLMRVIDQYTKMVDSIPVRPDQKEGQGDESQAEPGDEK